MSENIQPNHLLQKAAELVIRSIAAAEDRYAKGPAINLKEASNPPVIAFAVGLMGREKVQEIENKFAPIQTSLAAVSQGVSESGGRGLMVATAAYIESLGNTETPAEIQERNQRILSGELTARQFVKLLPALPGVERVPEFRTLADYEKLANRIESIIDKNRQSGHFDVDPIVDLRNGLGAQRFSEFTEAMGKSFMEANFSDIGNRTQRHMAQAEMIAAFCRSTAKGENQTREIIDQRNEQILFENTRGIKPSTPTYRAAPSGARMGSAQG